MARRIVSLKTTWAIPVALILLAGLTPLSAAHDGADIIQPPEDAVLADLVRIAEARGWSLNQAEQYFDREQAVGYVAQAVAEARP